MTFVAFDGTFLIPFVKVVLKGCAAGQRPGNHGRTQDGLKWQVA